MVFFETFYIFVFEGIMLGHYLKKDFNDIHATIGFYLKILITKSAKLLVRMYDAKREVRCYSIKKVRDDICTDVMNHRRYFIIFTPFLEKKDCYTKGYLWNTMILM